jgi:hypothetical protein
MKKTVATFGLASGILATVMMLVTIPFIRPATIQTADVLGYTSIVLSALLVFFGIRAYRERAGGRVSFGRGVAVGVLITLVSCAIHALAFEVIYFKVVPDFGERFSACMVDRVRASGAAAEQVDATARQAAMLKGLYDHPATNAALTFATSFPIGLAATVVSAAILRRR